MIGLPKMWKGDRKSGESDLPLLEVKPIPIIPSKARKPSF
jgi:hypothetical protein